MQGAAPSLEATNAAASTSASTVQPTHTYLRFKPADTNQLADLGDLGFNLSWEPMDESVAAVTTVDYQSDEIPYIYTVVPYGTTLPGSIRYEWISDLYLYNEEDGDAQDDPYQPPACQQWDPSCRCYVPCET